MKYVQKLKIQKSKLSSSHVFFILCLLFPHFEPGYFNDTGGTIDLFYNICKVISAFIILILYLKRGKTSYLFISFTMLWLYFFLNNTVKNGFSMGEIIRILSYIIVAMLVEYYVDKQARMLICSLVFLYEFLVIVNFITILIFPEGMYETKFQWQNYFLGFRNSFILYFIPCMTFEIIWAKYTGQWWRATIMFIVCFVSAAFSGSATCLLITITYIVLFMAGIYCYKIFNILVVTFSYIAVFLAVVIFRLQTLLEPLFNALGRNITMTGRTIIWDYTIQKIIQNPLTGYGKQSAEYRMAQIPNVYGASHAHNFFLEHLYCGGFIQLILLIVWLGLLYKNLWKTRCLKYTHIVMIAVVTFLFILLVEPGWDSGVYGFFMLAAYLKQIAVQMPIAEKKKKIIIINKFKNKILSS